jgi:hypothetical protein
MWHMAADRQIYLITHVLHFHANPACPCQMNSNLISLLGLWLDHVSQQHVLGKCMCIDSLKCFMQLWAVAEDSTLAFICTEAAGV